MTTYGYILLLLPMTMILSCKGQKEIIYLTKHQYIENQSIDTIHIIEKDSINTQKKGDTVFIEKIKYRWKIQKKTSIKSTEKNDTIFQKKEKIKVANKKTFWQKITSNIRIILIISIFSIFSIGLYKWNK